MDTRILVVVTSTDRRGAEIDGCRLAEELTARGLPARAVALAAGSTPHPLDIPTLGRRPLGVRTLWALRRLARRHDLVIAHGSTSLPACALALAGTSVPFVYRSIGDPTRWSRGRLHRARTGLLMRRARHVVALWDDAARAISVLYRVPSVQVAVVPNARDRRAPASPVDRSAERARLGAAHEDVLVLVVAALSSEKRVDRVVDAVDEDPVLRLAVAGDGPLRADLVARSTGDRVRFVGVVEDTTSLYAAADVVALLSETEGMPGVLLEADLAGCPVVATAVGAVPALHAAGLRGVVVAPDADTATIRRALHEAAATGRVATVGERPWDWSVVGAAWADLVDRLARR